MKKPKIGIVTARFNSEITELLHQGSLQALKKAGIPIKNIIDISVPGAIEIPLACKLLFQAGCEAVIANGAVIRGDTTHYDLVCNSVERGVTHLMLELGKPIAMGVLTTENEEQAFARAGGNMGNKGYEAAEVALEMLKLKLSLKRKK